MIDPLTVVTVDPLFLLSVCPTNGRYYLQARESWWPAKNGLWIEKTFAVIPSELRECLRIWFVSTFGPTNDDILAARTEWVMEAIHAHAHAGEQ